MPAPRDTRSAADRASTSRPAIRDAGRRRHAASCVSTAQYSRRHDRGRHALGEVRLGRRERRARSTTTGSVKMQAARRDGRHASSFLTGVALARVRSPFPIDDPRLVLRRVRAGTTRIDELVLAKLRRAAHRAVAALHRRASSSAARIWTRPASCRRATRWKRSSPTRRRTSARGSSTRCSSATSSSTTGPTSGPTCCSSRAARSAAATCGPSTTGSARP